LREKYVFREEVHPWKKHEITDPSTPKPNPNPFHYIAQPASSHVYKMVDGVVRVYANEAGKLCSLKLHHPTMFL
jgi:AMP deaminase